MTEHKLSRGQRRRRNKAWRKAGLYGKASTAERKASGAVALRVTLQDVIKRDPAAAPDARKRYKGLAGGQIRQSANLDGFYNGNRAKGRRPVTTIPVDEYNGYFS